MGRIVIAAYKPKPGKEDELVRLTQTHARRLFKEGLVTERRPIAMKAEDGTIIEVFEWKSKEAIAQAHANPAVQHMWEEYAAVCDYIPVADVPEASALFSEASPVETDSPSEAPDGFARITPYLLYADAAKAAQFLVESFGFEELEAERMTDGTGRVVHTALKLIDQIVLIGSPYPEFKGPNQVGCTAHTYVYVADADAHCSAARMSGAEIVTDPETAPYGDRRYAARDLEGHHWWFATRPEVDRGGSAGKVSARSH